MQGKEKRRRDSAVRSKRHIKLYRISTIGSTHWSPMREGGSLVHHKGTNRRKLRSRNSVSRPLAHRTGWSLKGGVNRGENISSFLKIKLERFSFLLK